MTKNSGGPTIDQGGDPTPAKAERDRELAGTAGNAAEKGEKPERGDTSCAGHEAAIDIDSAHDRAS
ncbi:MAG TPA: hypothetical protein VF782_09765 [Allosphingosinicella sp.]|jgi:hypothetical protein